MRRHAAPLGTSLLASTRMGPDTPEPRNSSPVAEKIPKSSLCVLSDGIRGQAREHRWEYIVGAVVKKSVGWSERKVRPLNGRAAARTAAGRAVTSVRDTEVRRRT